MQGLHLATFPPYSPSNGLPENEVILSAADEARQSAELAQALVIDQPSISKVPETSSTTSTLASSAIHHATSTTQPAPPEIPKKRAGQGPWTKLVHEVIPLFPQSKATLHTTGIDEKAHIFLMAIFGNSVYVLCDKDGLLSLWTYVTGSLL